MRALLLSVCRGRIILSLLLILAAVSASSRGPGIARADDLVGVVSTFAGSGQLGYGGDGGPAPGALFYEPRMSTFDADGRLYVADTFNQVIRVVDLDGRIGTVAGIARPVVKSDDGD